MTKKKITTVTTTEIVDDQGDGSKRTYLALILDESGSMEMVKRAWRYLEDRDQDSLEIEKRPDDRQYAVRLLPFKGPKGVDFDQFLKP